MLGSRELFGLWVLEAVICMLLPGTFSIMEVSVCLDYFGRWVCEVRTGLRGVCSFCVVPSAAQGETRGWL